MVIQESAFENVVCKLATILFGSQCVEARYCLYLCNSLVTRNEPSLTFLNRRTVKYANLAVNELSLVYGLFICGFIRWLRFLRHSLNTKVWKFLLYRMISNLIQSTTNFALHVICRHVSWSVDVILLHGTLNTTVFFEMQLLITAWDTCFWRPHLCVLIVTHSSTLSNSK